MAEENIDKPATTFVAADTADDDVFQIEPRPGARIRFGGRDVESGHQQAERFPNLGRSFTNTSQMSTDSMRSLGRRSSIDPAAAVR
jgi:sodium/potassium-transporting ATPase subunit alpha